MHSEGLAEFIILTSMQVPRQRHKMLNGYSQSSKRHMKVTFILDFICKKQYDIFQNDTHILYWRFNGQSSMNHRMLCTRKNRKLSVAFSLLLLSFV